MLPRTTHDAGSIMRNTNSPRNSGTRRQGASSRRSQIALVALVSTGALAGSVGTASAQTAAASQYDTPASGTVGTVADRLREIRYASFGTNDRRVRVLVRKALTEAGVAYRNYETNDARLARFVKSGLAKGLSTGGPESVGSRVGVELTRVTSRTIPLTQSLFGPDVRILPLTATVISRGVKIPATTAGFVKGFAQGVGSTGVPTVYVERSDAAKSFVSTYRKLPGVSIVDNIDTVEGRRRLVSLLAGGTGPSSAAGTTVSSTRATDRSLKAATAAAVVRDDTGSGLGPIAVLVALVGAVSFAAAGIFRRRGKAAGARR